MTGIGFPASTALMRCVGTNAAPVTSASTARPSGTQPVYWICALGVTPSNAITGDLIFNKAS